MSSRFLKPAAFFAVATAALFALSALGKVTPVQWGVIADSGLTALLDGGVQTSICLPNPTGTDAIYCTVQDAGASNVASVGVTLLGSNDCVNFAPIGTGVVFVGGPSTLSIESVTAAAGYYALQTDAGASAPAAGYLTCTISNKGTVP